MCLEAGQHFEECCSRIDAETGEEALSLQQPPPPTVFSFMPRIDRSHRHTPPTPSDVSDAPPSDEPAVDLTADTQAADEATTAERSTEDGGEAPSLAGAEEADETAASGDLMSSAVAEQAGASTPEKGGDDASEPAAEAGGDAVTEGASLGVPAEEMIEATPPVDIEATPSKATPPEAPEEPASVKASSAEEAPREPSSREAEPASPGADGTDPVSEEPADEAAPSEPDQTETSPEEPAPSAEVPEVEQVAVETKPQPSPEKDIAYAEAEAAMAAAAAEADEQEPQPPAESSTTSEEAAIKPGTTVLEAEPEQTSTPDTPPAVGEPQLEPDSVHYKVVGASKWPPAAAVAPA